LLTTAHNLHDILFADVAKEREVEGDLVLGDMGEGLPFRAGTFDYAISVSALQWLCNKDKTAHNPVQRMGKFFTSLYATLVISNCFLIVCNSLGKYFDFGFISVI